MTYSSSTVAGPADGTAARPANGIESWIASLARALGTSVKWRRRGHSLHLLCEAPHCPNQSVVAAQVKALLAQTNINAVLSPGDSLIHQLWCYGRSRGAYKPAWSMAIAVVRPAGAYRSSVVPEAPVREFSPPAPESAPTSPAPPKPETAIALALDKILSPLGITVTTRIKPCGQGKRLWVACQAAYSPTPNLIAKPLSAELRRLAPEGVRDAVVLVKVRGEAQVDWIVKIDLTPAEEILQGWGRWGDIEAIARLLNSQLQGPLQGKITAGERVGHSLRFIYSPPSEMASYHLQGRAANLEQVCDALSTYLKALSPQGIAQLQLAEIHPSIPVAQRPIASQGPVLESPWALAQAGELAAIRFLLSRRLNPDLDQQLATGGIRVQVLLKNQLLHVMCDGPCCPEEEQVSRPVQDLVAQLDVPAIHGVRVYGRRAGQRRPRWRTGTNFDRQNFVPEPPPAFAATDAYVTELVSPTAESPANIEAVPSSPLWQRWREITTAASQQARQVLLRSQVFTPSHNAQDLVQSHRNPALDLKVAVVWGTVGLLLFTQADLAAGWWMDARASAVESPPALSEAAPPEGTLSDAEAAAVIQQSPFPRFNNPQLDLKLALYHQRLQTVGPPDAIVIGSSRAMRGVEPTVLAAELETLGYPDADIFNFGVNGATAQVVDVILRRILRPEQLPKLVIWADGARAFKQRDNDETYQAILASEGYSALEAGELHGDAEQGDAEETAASDQDDRSQPSALYRRYQALDQWLSDRFGELSTAHPHRDRLKAWIVERFQFFRFGGTQAQEVESDGLDPVAANEADTGAEGGQESISLAQAFSVAKVDASGFLPITARFDPLTYYQQYARVPGNYDKDYANFDLQGAQTEALRQLIDLATTQDITLVFVNTPLTEDYLDPFRAGHEQTFRQYMIDTALQQDAFIFRDLARLWTQQTDSHQLFSDPSHLNRYGAQALSTYLASDPLIPWSLMK